MTIASFLLEVYIGLISHEQLVSAIAQTLHRGVVLIAVAQHHTVKLAAHIESDGVGGTITRTHLHQSFLKGIRQTRGNVGPIANAVRASHNRGLYCKERIFQSNIASSRKIIRHIHV